jgi:SAM-dependent methyltransferase
MTSLENRGAAAPEAAPPVPWQLRMFSKSLKKQQKLHLILRQLGSTHGLRCLLVTNGDNNGALNHHFRNAGGTWTWVENEREHIAEMEELLGEPVVHGSPERIPLPDASFDVVISIDVHEHLRDCHPFSKELARVVAPGGRVVASTPTGETWKPVTVLKHLVGMRKEDYGHIVVGYTLEDHEKMLRAAGLEPLARGTYSKFFTEMLELAINFAYVKVLARKKAGPKVKEGTIAPSSRDQIKAVEKQYRAYAAVYPLLRAIASLDALLFPLRGYAVSVVARRPK